MNEKGESRTERDESIKEAYQRRNTKPDKRPAEETMLCLFGGWAMKHLLDEVTMPPRAYLKQRSIETEGMQDESDFIEAMVGDAVCRAYHIGFKDGYNQGV